MSSYKKVIEANKAEQLPLSDHPLLGGSNERKTEQKELRGGFHSCIPNKAQKSATQAKFDL